jgi:hypothetical protein
MFDTTYKYTNRCARLLGEILRLNHKETVVFRATLLYDEMIEPFVVICNLPISNVYKEANYYSLQSRCNNVNYYSRSKT